VSEVESLAGLAGSRSQGYWLLSRLFLEPPDAGLLGDLQAAAATDSDVPALQADLVFLGEAVVEALRDPQAAAVEFTRRLTAVPRNSGEALPFASHVREGRTPGEATEQLQRRMGEWGYGAGLVAAVPVDQLGAVLRLMAILCHDERVAWLRGDGALAGECLLRQRELLTEHLVAWAPEYCQALAARAEHPYVQAIARLVASALPADAAVLESLCGQASADARQDCAAVH